MDINILCIGDVVGKPGRHVLCEHLPKLIEEYQVELVVCNAENAAGGSGITPANVKQLMEAGVDVITLGDHCFRKADILSMLESAGHIIRPANFPPDSVGRGWTVVQTKTSGHSVGVGCFLGQMNMGTVGAIDSPFAAFDAFAHSMDRQNAAIRVVDFHAETTSEKIAIGWYADGRASVVFGTHTHVPTADAGLLEKGTAFICDLGMTGPYDSILGRRKDRVLNFMVKSKPQRFEIALGRPRMYSLLCAVSAETGEAKSAQLLYHESKAPDGGPYDSSDGMGGYRHKNKK